MSAADPFVALRSMSPYLVTDGNVRVFNPFSDQLLNRPSQPAKRVEQPSIRVRALVKRIDAVRAKTREGQQYDHLRRTLDSL